jgi:hypothetical protein
MRVWNLQPLYTVTQSSKWARICCCTIPELLFVLKFHTGSYLYVLYSFISFHFCEGGLYFCFASKKYTGTSKFPFRTLMLLKNIGTFCAPSGVPFSFLYSFLMYLFFTFTLCLISYVYFWTWQVCGVFFFTNDFFNQKSTLSLVC